MQIISLARYKRIHENLKHCLIICGVNSLKWNWVNEVDKFCTEEKACILGNTLNTKGKNKTLTVAETKEQIDSCPEEFFWIINIERIRLNKEDDKARTGLVHHLNKQIESGNLGMVVVDEIHMSKDASSQTGKGLLEITPSVSKVGVTGTLLVNNPYDLYFPMTFTGLINYNKWAFEKKFVIKNEWGQAIGYQNMDELHNLLYKSSIRRTKDLLDLPDKIYKQEFLEFSKEEQAVFDAIIGRGNSDILDKIPPIFEMISVITRMRQASVACELLTTRTKKSTKFDRLNDILAEARINGQKVLVFCPFTEALKLGLEYCKEYSPKLVAGGMGDDIKKIVNTHENTNGFSVLFAQEATLGVGYTLTNTEIVVFLSPPWNKARYVQCQDRCHRIRTEKNCPNY